MGQVFAAGKEPQVRPTHLCDRVADRSTQHRMVDLGCIEDCALGYRALYLQLYFANDAPASAVSP
jgi:hypothetical protein